MVRGVVRSASSSLARLYADAQGTKVSGIRESASADSLASELLAERITPLTIDEQAPVADNDAWAQLKERLRRKRVELEELIIFCRQMYSLSKAGVPIIRAIGGLAESHRNLYFRDVLQNVRSDLEGGQGMAVALNGHPKVFNTLFVSMISVGENTGQLDQRFASSRCTWSWSAKPVNASSKPPVTRCLCSRRWRWRWW